ncbi:MAG: hypothetical protein ABI175_16865, partial [Polyangiales bacterium]
REVAAPRNRFAGSIFLFDQSMTVNSFHKNAQASYQPLYELWISPRIYYSPWEGVKFGARFDFFKEMFTNHEETTDRHETRVGDPWLTASFSRPMTFINRHPATRWAVGIVAKLPFSKESRADGQYLSIGPTASATVGFPLRGLDATWFPDMSFGLSAQYQHAFTRATTPTGRDFGVPGQDLEGNARINDQVRSQTLVGDSLIFALSGTLNITPKFNFSMSYLFIERFSHEPTDATFRGRVVERSPNDTRLRQLSWFIASLNYDPIKELEVSLGYYNLNTTVGPNGQYRSPFTSPEARVFLSLTVNLDVLYEDLRHREPTKTQPAPLRSTTARATFPTSQPQPSL